MAGPEAKIEAHLRDSVRDIGGLTLKIAPITAGVPDRLVLLPGGRIYLVELKSPSGRLREIQIWFHRRALSLGLDIPVLSSKEGVDRWISQVR